MTFDEFCNFDKFCNRHKGCTRCPFDDIAENQEECEKMFNEAIKDDKGLYVKYYIYLWPNGKC